MTDRSATETLWREYAASRAAAADDIRRVLEWGLGPRDWAGSRVLDLGCGDGAIAAAFAGAGGRVVAMDLDPWRVDNTRRLADDRPGARLDVVSADGHRLPFPRDRRVPGWYEGRLASGAAPKAPARRWLVSVARAPVVRWLLPRVLEGALFRLVVLPAWEFVASKPPAPAR
jgi:SAM-dependent methyltransferase